MATLLYSPAIRVRIETDNDGIIDVSDDITQFQVNRNVNAVSTFNFTLQNTQRKYDLKFKPSDRITVELKRITWVRVLTGSLNTVPIFSAWPRALSLSASCTLKKLQFWPWDPTTTAAASMISTYYGNGQQQATGNQGAQGLSNLITYSLSNVTNWNPRAIHIGQVPTNWFEFAEQVEELIDAAANMQAILGSAATIAGVSAGAVSFLKAGSYAGYTLNADQASVASTIFAIAYTQLGLTSTDDKIRAATIGIMTGLDESHLTNLSGGDRDSVGVFQQRPSQGWGTTAECENVVYAATAFFTHLLKIPAWNTMPMQLAAQAVQVSAYKDGSNYAAYQSIASDIVAAAYSAYTSPNAVNAANGTSVGTTTATKASGVAIASKAAQLMNAHPNSGINYQEGNDNADTTPIANVTRLDCSSTADWVYYQATGSPLWKSGGRSTVATIKPQCTAIPLDLAWQVQGAALFVGTTHVGISLGVASNGQWQYAAANTQGQVGIYGQKTNSFNSAGLFPGVDYSASAVNQAAATQLATYTGGKTTVSPGTLLTGTDETTASTSDTYAEIVTALSAAPVVSGNIFGGARELINNTPFLPWLTSLTNASMRAFCSAPNGDFIAWFPDYFGIWGTAATMDIQLIELQDFTIDWSDQQMVTHEFVIGSQKPLLDPLGGGIVDGGDQSYQGITAMINTQGVVNMEFPQIFQAIYGVPASQDFVNDYLERFGARPNVDQMSNVFTGQAEFYMALWNFMFYWAAQFSTQVPMTFMPELYPGMILRIPEYDFQCYVQSVQHSGSFGDNGQFTTTATVIAPARTSDKTNLFGLLPIGGQIVGSAS